MSEVNGFGTTNAPGTHHFRIELPRTTLTQHANGETHDGMVDVIEEFGQHGIDPETGEQAPARAITRARIRKSDWMTIRGIIETEFNQRLKSMSQPTWKFEHDTRRGRTTHHLNPTFGTELCLLIWATEHASVRANRDRAVNMWRHMLPEVRSWFYTNTVKRGGQHADHHEGWRTGIRSIFQTEYHRETPGGSKRKRKKEPMQDNQTPLLTTEVKHHE